MLKTLLSLCFFLMASCLFAFDAKAKDKIALYQPTQALSGNISVVGSDTLADLMSDWASVFKRFYPAVNVQIQTSGSASAVTALLEGTAQIGAMSRALHAQEMQQFERKYGYRLDGIKIGMDVIALYVNQDNPLKSIDLSAVDALYSRSSRCLQQKSIHLWGELGLTGRWKKKPIQLLGRNSISGTYDFFRKKLLCGGSYRSSVNELASSASVVQVVSSSLNAIGYAGISHQAAGAKMLALEIDGKPISANVENVINGTYPLRRELYVYVNKRPHQPLPRKEAEFLTFMLSMQGQGLVAAQGFIPLSKAMTEKELAKLL